MQQVRMNHAYCVDLNTCWKKTRFQLALNETFCPNQQPLPPPHRFSTQSLQYENLNTNKYSTVTVNGLGPPVLESSARISKFYAPTDSEHKFNKTEIENWQPIGYNLGSS